MNIDVLHCSNLPVIKFPTYTVIRRTIRQPQDEIMKTILLFFVLIPFRIPWVHGRYIKRPISDKIVLKLLNYRYLILRDRKKRLCQAESACISSQSYKIKYVWLSFNGFAAADASLVHLLSTCTLILAQVYIGPSEERVVWVQLHAVGRSCDSSCMLCSQYPPPPPVWRLAERHAAASKKRLQLHWDCSRVCELCMSDARTSRRSFCHSLALNERRRRCCCFWLASSLRFRTSTDKATKRGGAHESATFSQKKLPCSLGRLANLADWAGCANIWPQPEAESTARQYCLRQRGGGMELEG